jgi:hypothetical protein
MIPSPEQKPAQGLGAGLLVAAAVVAFVACASDDAIMPGPEPPAPSRRLAIALEMDHLEHPAVLDTLVRGCDAFLYGHPGAYEDRVARLETAGLESIRYFNVFSTDPLYPQWGGFYADLDRFLQETNGWIEGVGYAFYSNPDYPDRIIDHTRSEVSAGVADLVSTWADSIGADRVFLDLTFDTLDDWMIREGDRWPWPPEEHPDRVAAWAANMQSLIDAVALGHPVMINGSVRLAAPAVLYESQIWNDRRGFSPWEDLLARALAGETVPALHVGHHHLAGWEIPRAESMVLAAWLLLDGSYLLIEPEGRPLVWAREIAASGVGGFAATGPPFLVSRGFYRVNGSIDGAPWVAEVDLGTRTGRIYPAPAP